MQPEASDAIRIADDHLAGASPKRRKELALDIHQAIMNHAGRIAFEIVTETIEKQKLAALSTTEAGGK
jgi:hypothetical protein